MLIISQIKEFVDFWYIGNTEAFWGFAKGTFNSLEGELGVLPNIYNWYRPLFQDDDYKGKIIGPIFRTIRIFVGFAVYAFLAVLFTFFYLILFNFPIVVLYMIWRNLSQLFLR